MLKKGGWVIFCCGLMLGCDNAYQLEKDLDLYQQRMANILDAESLEFETVVLPRYPARQLLEQNIAEQNIKLFEFYQLKQCRLYSMVAERNTTLGRIQSPSTRYVYEKSLLTALNDCLEKTTDSQLQEKMHNWLELKNQSISTKWADLIQLSDEIKQGFSAHRGLIDGSIKDGLHQTKEAFNYLLGLETTKQVNSSELEQHLKHIHDQPLPAKLWLSQLLLRVQLGQINTWLNQHAGELTCQTRQQKETAEYLRNVFQLFFVEKIQPVASQLNHYHYQLNPIFTRLVEHASLSEAYAKYIQTQHFDEFSEYQTAMRNHLVFWQALFKACHMRPGT